MPRAKNAKNAKYASRQAAKNAKNVDNASRQAAKFAKRSRDWECPLFPDELGGLGGLARGILGIFDGLGARHPVPPWRGLGHHLIPVKAAPGTLP